MPWECSSSGAEDGPTSRFQRSGQSSTLSCGGTQHKIDHRYLNRDGQLDTSESGFGRWPSRNLGKQVEEVAKPASRQNHAPTLLRVRVTSNTRDMKTYGGSVFVLADLAWLIAAFRPERDPQLTMMLNDLAWMAFITPVGFILAQNLCLALAIYMDARSKPVFPRWVGHFNILAALLMTPGAFALMFREGPLAWDRSLAFGLRLGTRCSKRCDTAPSW